MDEYDWAVWGNRKIIGFRSAKTSAAIKFINGRDHRQLTKRRRQDCCHQRHGQITTFVHYGRSSLPTTEKNMCTCLFVLVEENGTYGFFYETLHGCHNDGMSNGLTLFDISWNRQIAKWEEDYVIFCTENIFKIILIYYNFYSH